MADDRRWKKAQRYERDHWAQVARRADLDPDTLSWYRWRADRLHERLAQQIPGLDLARASVLEVGSGPVGTIAFLEANERHAIDPLEDFYAQEPSLIGLRDDRVGYQAGGGEHLPFDDAKFDLVIIDNVIDHTRSPQGVLGEIHRVLKPAGTMYLSVNVHTRWGLWVRRTMEWFQLDRGHPYSFTPQTAGKMIRRASFQVVYTEMEDFETARDKERQAGRLRNRLKLWLGIYDVLFEALALKV